MLSRHNYHPGNAGAREVVSAEPCLQESGNGETDSAIQASVV